MYRTGFGKSVFVFVLLTVFIISGCASNKPKEVVVPHKISNGMSKNSYAVYFYNAAERLSNSNNIDEALRYYSRALRFDPMFAAAYMGKGLIFYGSDNEKALNFLNKAIEIDKYYVRAYYNRAVIRIQLNQFEKAITDFTTAITLKPKYGKAYYNRAHLYVKLKEPEKALYDFNKAIEFKKDDPSMFFHRGYLQLTENIGDRGLSDFLKAAKLNPKYNQAFYNIACIYSIKGDFENTEIYLRKAIKAGFKKTAFIKKDPDLENFRKSSKFEGFFKSIEN